MELFFLCTIIMAGISFLSIALSQPPVNYSFKIKGDTTIENQQTDTEGQPRKVSFGHIQNLQELAIYRVAG